MITLSHTASRACNTSLIVLNVLVTSQFTSNHTYVIKETRSNNNNRFVIHMQSPHVLFVHVYMLHVNTMNIIALINVCKSNMQTSPQFQQFRKEKEFPSAESLFYN
jgi:hypothetical protein